MPEINERTREWLAQVPSDLRDAIPEGVVEQPPFQQPPQSGAAGPPSPPMSQEQVRQQIGNDQPSIATPMDGTVTLPGGWIAPDGVLHQEAKVRELTGEDEEVLATHDPAKNVANFITTIVKRGTISIGSYPMDEQLAKSLLMGDRLELVMQIRKVTFGQEISVGMYCPVCEQNSDVFFDIDSEEDFPRRRLENPMQRVFDIELRSGRVAKVMLPTGWVHEKAMEGNKTPAQLNTIMLASCVKEIGGFEPITEREVRALGISDRTKIIDFVMEKQPGAKLDERPAPCSGCGREYPVNLSLANFFQ